MKILNLIKYLKGFVNNKIEDHYDSFDFYADDITFSLGNNKKSGVIFGSDFDLFYGNSSDSFYMNNTTLEGALSYEVTYGDRNV